MRECGCAYQIKRKSFPVADRIMKFFFLGLGITPAVSPKLQPSLSKGDPSVTRVKNKLAASKPSSNQHENGRRLLSPGAGSSLRWHNDAGRKMRDTVLLLHAIAFLTRRTQQVIENKKKVPKWNLRKTRENPTKTRRNPTKPERASPISSS
jgi:hypothetical protein